MSRKPTRFSAHAVLNRQYNIKRPTARGSSTVIIIWKWRRLINYCPLVLNWYNCIWHMVDTSPERTVMYNLLKLLLRFISITVLPSIVNKDILNRNSRAVCDAMANPREAISTCCFHNVTCTAKNVTVSARTCQQYVRAFSLWHLVAFQYYRSIQFSTVVGVKNFVSMLLQTTKQ